MIHSQLQKGEKKKEKKIGIALKRTNHIKQGKRSFSKFKIAIGLENNFAHHLMPNKNIARNAHSETGRLKGHHHLSEKEFNGKTQRQTLFLFCSSSALIYICNSPTCEVL